MNTLLSRRLPRAVLPVCLGLAALASSAPAATNSTWTGAGGIPSAGLVRVLSGTLNLASGLVDLAKSATAFQTGGHDLVAFTGNVTASFNVTAPNAAFARVVLREHRQIFRHIEKCRVASAEASMRSH